MVKLPSGSGPLPSDNRAQLEKHSAQFGKDQRYTALLAVIADICDIAAAGGDAYLVIGTNRAKTELLLTVHQDGVKGYLSAIELVGLSVACESLL